MRHALLLACVLGALAGCGQKGALVLPTPKSSVPTPAAASSSSSSGGAPAAGRAP